MREEYTYAELKRMSKKRVIRIAGFKNMNDLLKHFETRGGGYKHPIFKNVNPSKKWIARQIASDR